MNEQFTRVSLAKAGSGQTDWIRVNALTEAEIISAIAEDEDAFALSDKDLALLLARLGTKSPRLMIRSGRNGRFRWALLGADGAVIAEDRRGEMSRAKARSAILAYRRAIP
jgi:hypothetical protein